MARIGVKVNANRQCAPHMVTKPRTVVKQLEIRQMPRILSWGICPRRMDGTLWHSDSSSKLSSLHLLSYQIQWKYERATHHLKKVGGTSSSAVIFDECSPLNNLQKRMKCLDQDQKYSSESSSSRLQEWGFQINVSSHFTGKVIRRCPKVKLTLYRHVLHHSWLELLLDHRQTMKVDKRLKKRSWIRQPR